MQDVRVGVGDPSEYPYFDARPGHTATYLWPTVLDLVRRELAFNDGRVFELGCGNGAFAAALAREGYDVTGVDPSTMALEHANRAYPGLKLYKGSSYDALTDRFGRFRVVIGLEVVEHVYSPRAFARCVYDLLVDGGLAIISTPYHGYSKNLLLALTGKLDAHFTALWDHGHIKFWSQRTLAVLLAETGFVDISMKRVGRVPPFAKSLIAVGRRPR
jgi:2-polyprenyl-6-hydroxyphenyl methylase/3-demethylubiquinone-9 3-methyltransferase